MLGKPLNEVMDYSAWGHYLSGNVNDEREVALKDMFQQKKQVGRGSVFQERKEGLKLSHTLRCGFPTQCQSGVGRWAHEGGVVSQRAGRWWWAGGIA